MSESHLKAEGISLGLVAHYFQDAHKMFSCYILDRVGAEEMEGSKRKIVESTSLLE